MCQKTKLDQKEHLVCCFSIHSQQIEHQYGMNGINISRVEIGDNQTRFECFASSGNGMQVDASDIATLTVTKESKLYPVFSITSANYFVI